MTDISDRRMSYLVALVEQQSFSRAAAYCGVSQSALSQQIVKLEREIGATLLDRTIRPFALTAIGQEVYARALAIMENYREIANAGRRSSAGTIGRVRAGIVPSLLYLGAIPAALRRFRADFANVEVDLARLDNAVAVDRLIKHQVDVVFSFSGVENPGIGGLELGDEELMVALADTHPLARHSALDLAELRHEPFISFPRDAYADTHDELVHAARLHGFAPTIRNVYATFIEHLGFVTAGYGVALVPASIRRHAGPGVALVALKSPELRLRTRLHWRRDSIDPSVQHFIRSMRETLPGGDHE